MVFPFFIDIENKKCLIIGGGRVALRKDSVLLYFGATLTVIDPDFCKDFERFNLSQSMGKISFVRRNFQIDDIKNAFMVIAATDDSELNTFIGKECIRLGIHVNTATDRENSSFIFPSVITRGQTVVGISTSGNSPVLSRKIREDIDSILPDFLEQAAIQLGEIRQTVLCRTSDENIRREIFRHILNKIYEKGRPLSHREIKNILKKWD